MSFPHLEVEHVPLDTQFVALDGMDGVFPAQSSMIPTSQIRTTWHKESQTMQNPTRDGAPLLLSFMPPS